MSDNISENVNEIDRDAQVAAEMGSSVPGRRTPRWVLSWLLPLLAILVLYLSRQILGPFIIAAVIAYIFSIVVDTLQDRLHWPRLLIVALLYLLVLGAIGIG